MTLSTSVAGQAGSVSPALATSAAKSVILGVLLFFPTRWFANLKQRRRDIAILKYL